MSSVGLLTLMLYLTPPNNQFPANPIFKETTVVCSSILYTYSKDGYPYIGIVVEGNKYYLTNEKLYDTVHKEITTQCGK